MTTANNSFRSGHVIRDAWDARWRSLGYPTRSDYWKSLGRYDLLIAKPHTATGELHTLSDEAQESFDCNLSAAYLRGETTGGTALDRLIRQIICEMGQPSIEPTKVAVKIARLLAKQ